MGVHLVVTYNDHQIMFYPVNSSWKIDNASRCLVVGKFPRTYIPLDRVLSFDIQSCPEEHHAQAVPALHQAPADLLLSDRVSG